MNEKSSAEHQSSYIEQCVDATSDYYYALFKLLVLYSSNTASHAVGTPACTMLYIVMVPVVNFLYNRRLHAYAFAYATGIAR